MRGLIGRPPAEAGARTLAATTLQAPEAVIGAKVGGPMEAVGAPIPAIRLRGVTAGYGERIALEDVDLEIPAGALVAVVGPNGGGKSTLLKLIAGVLKPWTGTVEVLGARAGREAHRVAYVPQAELVDWSFPVNVWNVAMMGRYPRLGPLRQPGRADNEAVEAALERVGCWTGRARRSGRSPAVSGVAPSWPARWPPKSICTCSTSRSPASTSPPRRPS